MAPDGAKKRFGQHFLTSQAIIRRIVDLVEPHTGDVIVEIGPGRGALTVPLADSGAEVVAVEYEREAFAFLRGLLSERRNVTLVNEDFLALTPSRIGYARFKLVGNLPYNISSPVIEWTVLHKNHITVAVFMLQKEVARRLSASPGSKDWCPLAIFTQLAYNVEYSFEVPARCFQPPPRVTSAVVKMIPRVSTPVGNYPLFERVVRSSFRHRRKLLVNNLAGDVVPEATAARGILAELGWSEKVRAEEVSTEEFLTLTAALIERNILS